MTAVKLAAIALCAAVAGSAAESSVSAGRVVGAPNAIFMTGLHFNPAEFNLETFRVNPRLLTLDPIAIMRIGDRLMISSPDPYVFQVLWWSAFGWANGPGSDISEALVSNNPTAGRFYASPAFIHPGTYHFAVIMRYDAPPPAEQNHPAFIEVDGTVTVEQPFVAPPITLAPSVSAAPAEPATALRAQGRMMTGGQRYGDAR